MYRIKATLLHIKKTNINNLIVVYCSSFGTKKKLIDCYRELNIPIHSTQDVVRKAFLELAKKYHPDSGSDSADIQKFCAIENAFRVLTKHNTGTSWCHEAEQIVFDIKHTAPQHRQYLSYDGVGYGTPSQRMKQWIQYRAEKAVQNITQHRMSKAVASEDTLMKKEPDAKHDIKTKYGFDRLVEDLIQESMSKGEFDNLKGTGKPLENQNNNPYVDFTTQKLNEVLINNGFTPEWITMNKEIEQDIRQLKEDLKLERMTLGPCPLNADENWTWKKICYGYRDLTKSINTKIDTYNLIVPLLNKQKFHIKFDDICQEVLLNGPTSINGNMQNIAVKQSKPVRNEVFDSSTDLLGLFFKGLIDLFTDVLKVFSKNNRNVRDQREL